MACVTICKVKIAAILNRVCVNIDAKNVQKINHMLRFYFHRQMDSVVGPIVYQIQELQLQ